MPTITVTNKDESSPGIKAEGAASTDPHNETTVSEISADITLDSVKDHTV